MKPLPGAELSILRRMCDVYGTAAVASALAVRVDEDAHQAEDDQQRRRLLTARVALEWTVDTIDRIQPINDLDVLRLVAELVRAGAVEP